jgi:hypothetical protein
MLPKIKAEFCITGLRATPEEITESINVIPTQTWRLGDVVQGTELHRKHNGWCLEFEESDFLDLAMAADSLLRSLLPNSKKIKHACEVYDLQCELSFAVYIVDETPIINFGHEIISGLAELGANIDIDIILTTAS